MKRIPISVLLCVFFSTNAAWLAAQTGPFSPEAWPATRQAAKTVHYYSYDPAFTPVSPTWLADQLTILSGGDQVTQPITIGGHTGVKTVGNYLNIADLMFEEWADDDAIDILMQVYGDSALLSAAGNPRNFTFLTGTLPELVAPVGGSLPVEAKNQKWNWVLFRVPNGIRPSDGSHYVGSIPANVQGGAPYGGVNGGTIRVQGVPNLIVRLVAFGEQGAFGETNEVNVFAAGDACAPEPPTNLVFTDINTKTNFHLTVLTNADQTVAFQDNVGPAGDRRRAVRPLGTYMNFGILDEFLGKPCNEPRNMKLSVEFYDDPALAGVTFGPEAYATDSTGGIATYPAARRHTLEGTGQWVRRAFAVASVNLKGVNTAPLTGGPRLVFDNNQVFISRVDLGIFRAGTNALAGQDPLPNSFEDPKICTGVYGNYAELDVDKGISTGLGLGSSGGDQVMVVEEAGPTSDRRQAVRPDGTPGIYLNFAILDQALGPSSQDNAHLAICVTYYDDPALAGGTLRPEVYQSDRGGLTTFAFTPGSAAVALEGSDRWRNAYWELPDVKFTGVNQGPQAAARFALTRQIFVTSVRYAVIRPCGATAGVNLLADCLAADKPTLQIQLNPDKTVRLGWATNAVGFMLESTTNLDTPQWTAVTNTVTVTGSLNTLIQTPGAKSRYYRLAK